MESRVPSGKLDVNVYIVHIFICLVDSAENSFSKRIRFLKLTSCRVNFFDVLLQYSFDSVKTNQVLSNVFIYNFGEI